ncbi:hypothetical protein SAMN06264365_1352 [Actinoplanes regularis]|uniref:Uncharacterized protein n=2 Tax=Actinoplanes regularis TaxID=52697 RepID=A0A239JHZ7_9ACTN|nr:hypothetical protein Are01nite_84620 [Actinoplanes regularis]SNT04354.1 hypothetical protein SAMN06264365_1352 [Actinoplanes regularis]
MERAGESGAVVDTPDPPKRSRPRYLVPVLVALAVLVVAGSFGAGIFLGRSPETDNVAGATAGPSADPRFTEAMKFVTCMRGNGVSNYPAPQPNGELLLTNESGVDIASKAYQSAESACKSFLPSGMSQGGEQPGGAGGPAGADAASGQPSLPARDLTKYVKCMRGEGVTQFPDADALGNFSDVDPNWPGLQDAQASCAKYLPPGSPGAPR